MRSMADLTTLWLTPLASNTRSSLFLMMMIVMTVMKKKMTLRMVKMMVNLINSCVGQTVDSPLLGGIPFSFRFPF